MPKIEVIRKGITPAVRPVPTDTTLVVLPVTLDQMGKEVESEDEQAVRVDSVNDAFEKFKPSIHFETQAGAEATEFVADLEFRSLKDFSPENIQKRIPGQRNDIADLKNAIDLLYRMKDRWSLPSVKRAWSNPAQRKQIIAALARLHAELEKIAQTRKGGE
ncbi:MAG TPA: type VI secretion system contractile sheath small subunit [Blastocatellia bacterium]|nr:type VI secretion system contractile sheath small subunit [Blastocatellia bacterium]